MTSPRLLDLSFEDLENLLSDMPHFRAPQIWNGVYVQLAQGYDEITTLPKPLRDRLAAQLPFTVADVVATALSTDGKTVKSLHRLEDSETIEAVTMMYPDRATVCVSSQVGCAVGCPFCATGDGGFVRDLAPGEIVEQALHAARQVRAAGRRLSNIVLMGMGEPFLNYEAVLSSIRILNDERGFHLGARSFTVSTAGVVPGIERFADEHLQANLAISLHTADNTLRDRLVPLNRRYPIPDLMSACRKYIAKTNRRVSFEVAMIDGVNDAPEDAHAVARLLGGLLCHVNLIPYNPTANPHLAASEETRVESFAAILGDKHIPVTVRQSMGADIQAGCGQLRAQRDVNCS